MGGKKGIPSQKQKAAEKAKDQAAAEAQAKEDAAWAAAGVLHTSNMHSWARMCSVVPAAAVPRAAAPWAAIAASFCSSAHQFAQALTACACCL